MGSLRGQDEVRRRAYRRLRGSLAKESFSFFLTVAMEPRSGGEARGVAAQANTEGRHWQCQMGSLRGQDEVRRRAYRRLRGSLAKESFSFFLTVAMEPRSGGEARGVAAQANTEGRPWQCQMGSLRGQDEVRRRAYRRLRGSLAKESFSFFL